MIFQLFINYISFLSSGSVTAGLAIYDTMQYVLPPISTWCVGQACSMGSLLLERYPNQKRVDVF